MSSAVTAPTTDIPPDAGRRGRAAAGLASAGWIAHWLLRVGLAGYLAVYGWSKVFLLQMGQADLGDALVRYGEMSPMGLLWRMVGFSPLFQVFAGVAEVTAAVLLVWRRTAALGALLGAADMAFVFVLNLAYDVPVKQLSLAMCLGCLVVLAPYVPRLLRAFFSFGPVSAGPVAEPMPFARLRPVTRFLGPLLGLALVAAPGVAVFGMTRGAGPQQLELAGVYRVTHDARRPAAQLADDGRWSEVSFGDLGHEGRAAVGVRLADGRLVSGTYRITGPGTVEITAGNTLDRTSETGLAKRPVPSRTYSFRRSGDTIELTGSGQSLTLTSDAEGRFLYDRDFAWDGRRALNR